MRCGKCEQAEVKRHSQKRRVIEHLTGPRTVYLQVWRCPKCGDCTMQPVYDDAQYHTKWGADVVREVRRLYTRHGRTIGRIQKQMRLAHPNCPTVPMTTIHDWLREVREVRGYHQGAAEKTQK